MHAKPTFASHSRIRSGSAGTTQRYASRSLKSRAGTTVGTSRTVLRQLIGKLLNRADSNTTRTDVPTVFEPEKDTRVFVTHKLFSSEDLERLEAAIGYRIKNPAYFEQALIHRSYLQIAEHETIVSNERLEFLGDSILNMLIGEFLFHRYADI